jgi:ABC-2 type transport system permease protein
MPVTDFQSRAQQMIAIRNEAGLQRAIVDSFLIGWRNLLRLSRTPSVIVSVLLFPILFLTGFLLAFERFMQAQGIDYIQYLVPIITLQAMFFTAMSSATTLANDIKTGMLQRCRAMPISRAAVVGGLLIAYLVRSLIVTAILIPFAYLYGFRFQPNLFAVLGFVVLVLLFTTTAVFGYAILALSLRQPDLVSSMLIVPYAPLLLLSTGFSPAENFPEWLQPFVRIQPVSLTAAAMRAIANGEPAFPTLVWALLWLIGLLVLFGFLAIRLYQKVSG